jgi:ketosteroid isomerase-like protein
MNQPTVAAVMAASLLGVGSSVAAPPDVASAKAQVLATERAFAKTMADRNQARFSDFISDEAVFFSGPSPLRGKAAVVQWWARYFAAPEAPFSWEPDEVEVLDSGTLALSSGPVRDSSGKLMARFTSIWRYEMPGTWRIIFDKGESVAAPAQ